MVLCALDKFVFKVEVDGAALSEGHAYLVVLVVIGVVEDYGRVLGDSISVVEVASALVVALRRKTCEAGVVSIKGVDPQEH